MTYAHGDYTSEDVRITFIGDVETNDIGSERRILSRDVTNIRVTSVALFGVTVDLDRVPSEWMEEFMHMADHVYFDVGG